MPHLTIFYQVNAPCIRACSNLSAPTTLSLRPSPLSLSLFRYFIWQLAVELSAFSASIGNSCRSVLRVAHVNIWSFVPHFSLVKDLIALLHLDVLVVGKTWLRKTTDSNIINSGSHRLLRSDRSSKEGVVLYIADSPVLLYRSGCFPCLYIIAALISVRHKRLDIVYVYRPPRSPLVDLSTSKTVYYTSYALRKSICLRDFNVDMLCFSDRDALFLTGMATHLLLRQLIDSPTRFLRNSSSILDLTFM